MSSTPFQHPRPGITSDNAFFWEGLARGELRIQRCNDCGTRMHPPRPMCHGCHSFSLGWIVASGSGTVHSFVVAHHPPVPPFDYPNVIALVDLDEGTRLVSRLVGVSPEEVRIGMAVRVEFETVDGDLALHRFRPVAGDRA